MAGSLIEQLAARQLVLERRAHEIAAAKPLQEPAFARKPAPEYLADRKEPETGKAAEDADLKRQAADFSPEELVGWYGRLQKWAERLTARGKNLDQREHTIQADKAELNAMRERLRESEERGLVGTTIEDMSGNKTERYTIGDRLSKGGVTSVYLATDLQTGERVIAKRLSKYFHPMQADLAYFCREMMVGREFSHPGIVKVLNFIEDNAGIWCIMKYEPHKILKEKIAETKGLPPELAGEIAIRLCEILEFVHARGIAHRDVKSENIGLQRKGDAHQVILLDFGIAQEIGKPNVDLGDFIRTTRMYSAPEQYERDALVHPRIDIYQAGVVLYAMLTGVRPFEKWKEKEQELVHKKRITTPPTLREQRPDLVLPDGLEEAVARALARNPKERYQSATELREALERIFG